MAKMLLVLLMRLLHTVGTCSVCQVHMYVGIPARQQHYDVVLVDTAGRMQDNEPLMKSLAKVLFAVYASSYLTCLLLSSYE